MLNIVSCREILNEYGYSINDEEIMELRDFLMMVAFSQLAENKTNNNDLNTNNHEESNIIL
jgi:hypothetical protein